MTLPSTHARSNGYRARLGWDPVTGWGSQNAQVLMPLLPPGRFDPATAAGSDRRADVRPPLPRGVAAMSNLALSGFPRRRPRCGGRVSRPPLWGVWCGGQLRELRVLVRAPLPWVVVAWLPADALPPCP